MAARSLVAYMRAHGNTPGPAQRPYLAGVLAGTLAAAPAVLVLWSSGALASAAAALGQAVPIVLAVYAGALAVAGAAYGRVFGRAANDRRGGWLFGASFGYLIWMLGPAGSLPWLLGSPLAVGKAALGLLLGHLIHGVALGAVFPYVHRRLVRAVLQSPGLGTARADGGRGPAASRAAASRPRGTAPAPAEGR
jgi:hypothetical protein